MTLGETARTAGHALKAVALAAALAFAPATAHAVVANDLGERGAIATDADPIETASAAPVAAPVVAAPAPVAAIDPNDPHFKVAPGGYTPMAPTPGKGMPVAKGLDIQKQYSPIGEQAAPFHNFLLILCAVIAVFVLLLLLFVMVKFRRSANPVPSTNSHNTVLEIVWITIPAIILFAIAFPSFALLSEQYKPAPAKAVTVKATGSQWYWTYSYPDNGGFEVVSNMLPDAEAQKRGEPPQLAADFRMVVPAGETIRMQVTASDVIHAFAVPSLWYKIDAVPGKINEMTLFINEPGVYYGQCSELCGARHGYMPIVVEALPRDKYNAWVLTQSGGKIDGMPEAPAAPAAAAPAAAATPAAAPAATASASPAPAV